MLKFSIGLHIIFKISYHASPHKTREPSGQSKGVPKDLLVKTSPELSHHNSKSKCFLLDSN